MLRALVFCLVASLAAVACAPQGSRVPDSRSRSLQERFNTLGDAMRTLPNVQVDGDVARYRGASSFGGDDVVRIAAEGRIIGTLADAERLYPLDEITHLRLIRPVDAQQRYGSLGANGVVELILRKS